MRIHRPLWAEQAAEQQQSSNSKKCYSSRF